MVDEGATEEKRLRNEREFTRSNSKKILEVLRELFPAWNWQTIPAEGFDQHETRVHFLHDKQPNSGQPTDILGSERVLTDMLYHSVLFYMSTSKEEREIASSCPRLYYNLEGVERLLVVYRACARLNSSDSEYERINSLVTSCFV